MGRQRVRPQYTIGVDIAQEECVWVVLDGPTQTVQAEGKVARTPKALASWAARLRQHWPHALVVLEATGGLERWVRQALHQAGLAVVVANPKRVQRLREAGGWAKTDSQDALALATWGWLFAAPQPQPSPAEERMRELVRRRQQLVDMLHRERMRYQRSQDAFVREQIQYMMTLLEEQLRRLEEEIQRQWERWQQDDPQVAEDLQLLQSMPGVGWWTALTLRLFLPEWGQLDAKQVAALSGLAPMARDSGKKRGRRRIYGGRRRIRGALYMVALHWIRRKQGPLWAFYERLRRRGKPTFVAMVALMRRILVILNAMLRDRIPWTPEKAMART